MESAVTATKPVTNEIVQLVSKVKFLIVIVD